MITLVYCVLCLNDDGSEVVHIFSTPEAASDYADRDPRDHVLYDYVVDFPERMESAVS